MQEVDGEVKSPLPGPETRVEVKVDWGETEVGIEVERAGGVWNTQQKLW